MFHNYSYVPHRRALYLLIWALSVAELGLTATRIHFTRKNFSTHESIVAELLVTSILTILWVPLTLIFHRSAPGLDTRNTAPGTANTPHSRFPGRFGGLHHESSGNIVLWIMWLVGAAIAAHTWPTHAAAGFTHQGRILLAIVGVAFTVFGLLTLAKVLALMEYSAIGVSTYGGPGAGHATRPEKAGYPATNAPTTTAPGGAGYAPGTNGATTTTAPAV
ncbi:hypothetical protein R3P38DRAFT_2882989 [Favolaschia claudopus]|uniref:MARVEL domain-containing protein n=1 Tax=Favolaschia claudopus TaxID=2862362 RepID=A0AAW0D3R7_9AGAR